MITGRHEARMMSDQLIDLHLAHLRAGGKSDRTIEARTNVLNRLNDRLPFGLIYAATEQLEGWLAELREHGRSRWTLATYSYHVRAFYRWATAAGFQDGDPATAMPRASAPRLLPNPATEDELAAILDLPEPICTAAVLAGWAGMRVSEIAACRREHVTAEKILIPSGKGEKMGIVDTHPFVWEWLHDRPPGLLILNRYGKPVSGHWISMTARYHLNKIGLQRVHLHMLRHRYGTLIQETVGDLRVTQECLRHANINSTAGYTLVAGSRRREAVLTLPVPVTRATPEPMNPGPAPASM